MRVVSAAAFLVSLSILALVGCHPTFEGTTANRDGNGQGPDPIPGQTQVTSISPSTVAAATASFTLTVNGSNFAPSTTVIWNTYTSLVTTYVSSTVLQAQVPASLIARPDTVSILASPVGAINFGPNLTITVPPLIGNSAYSLSVIPVEANDLVWNMANQQFYLSVASASRTLATSITALNPQTGVFGPSISTTGEPGALAVSTDGTYLYAGLSSTGTIRRYALPALQSDIDIPLGSNGLEPYYAIDIQGEPGSPHSVAVSRGAKGFFPLEVGGVLIYDDAVARSQSVAGVVPGTSSGQGPIDLLTWNLNGQSLYGASSEDASGPYTILANSSGAQFQSQLKAGGPSFGNHVHFDASTGYLYSDLGKVVDPATDSLIGTFPLSDMQGGFVSPPIMVTDGQLNLAYFLGETNFGFTQGNYVIEAYDLTHFKFLGAIPITKVQGVPTKMIRWGNSGLAFLTTTPGGTSTSGDGVYLISGGFVTSPAP